MENRDLENYKRCLKNRDSFNYRLINKLDSLQEKIDELEIKMNESIK